MWFLLQCLKTDMEPEDLHRVSQSGMQGLGAPAALLDCPLLRVEALEKTRTCLLPRKDSVPLKGEHGHKQMTQKELVFCAQRRPEIKGDHS